METKTTNNGAQGVAVVENRNENGVVTVDLNGGILPDLSKVEAYPFDLMADYWTPENQGEAKRVFFDKIANRPVADQQTGEVIELDCAFFIEVNDKGEAKTISNGSKRLVGALEAHQIKRGTPLLITYMGKRKNRTNSFQSDSWSIKPLRLNI